MGLKEENKDTIKKAFARWKSSVGPAVVEVMAKYLENAVKYALEFHDDKHQNHLEVGDSYGWCLAYKGKILRTEVRMTGNDIGDVKATLERETRKQKGKGYVGVVMAGLNPTDYFVVDYEMDVLKASAEITEQEFAELFKKVES